MRLRLAPTSTLMSKDAHTLLQSGDVDALLEFHRATFGSARMEGEDDKEDDEDEEDDTGSAGDSEEDKTKDDGGDAKSKELSDENMRRRHENKALKKQLEEQAAKLKAIEDKDKDELTKTTGDLTEAQAKAEKLVEANTKLMIQNAFLMDNKHAWENPKAALKLADLSEVEIDDEGNVTGLKEALDALAKSDPYLLSKKKDDEEDDEPGATGQPPTKKSKGNPSRDKLVEKYPALRR